MPHDLALVHFALILLVIGLLGAEERDHPWRRL